MESVERHAAQIIHHYHYVCIALFSALEQIHCALVACNCEGVTGRFYCMF